MKLKGVEVNYNTEQPKYYHQHILAEMPIQPLIDRI